MLKRITKETYLSADEVYDIMKDKLRHEDDVDDVSEWTIIDSQLDETNGITYVWEHKSEWTESSADEA